MPAVPDVVAGPPAPQAVADSATAVQMPPTASLLMKVRVDISVDSLSLERKWVRMMRGEKTFCQNVVALTLGLHWFACQASLRVEFSIDAARPAALT
ncbi:hypothetical protein ARTHROSP310_02980 [Arthrobacter sp. AD-310]